jgi:hypothetical protein
VAFFGTGYYSGLGTVTAEIYSTGARATGQGFTYDMGRIASAAAPFTAGSMAQTSGFGTAFSSPLYSGSGSRRRRTAALRSCRGTGSERRRHREFQ